MDRLCCVFVARTDCQACACFLLSEATDEHRSLALRHCLDGHALHLLLRLTTRRVVDLCRAMTSPRR
jgi:hypothetical protein